jgi:hypothetical protein
MSLFGNWADLEKNSYTGRNQKQNHIKTIAALGIRGVITI